MATNIHKDKTCDELAFLPAALEIQETPPAPMGRMILWVIILFFVVAVAWAAVGETDIVAVAQGKIIPAGRSKVIQPLEIGKVAQIHVREGQAVEAGDVLIELDPTTQQADSSRVRTELATAQAGGARIEALLAALANGDMTAGAYFEPPAGVDVTVVNRQRELLDNQMNEHLARDRSVVAEIARKRAEHDSIKAEIRKLRDVLPIVTERAQSHRTLASKHLVAKNEYLRLEQERIEHVQDLAALKSRGRELLQAIEQANAQRASLKAELQAKLVAEQVDLDARISGLGQELIKVDTRTGLQQLRAPVDGVVQQLAVHTLGGVVTPAQALMTIVPNERELEVEAFVQNKDIGFVEEGHVASVKVDAFPFTKYGTVDGEILNVSNDAVENETLGWAFTARVAMGDDTIVVGEKRVNLTPGMSVTVEVKTGKRKLIEYFLSPLLRYQHETVRER